MKNLFRNESCASDDRCTKNFSELLQNQAPWRMFKILPGSKLFFNRGNTFIGKTAGIDVFKVLQIGINMLSAKPCIVTKRELFTPIAHIFLDRRFSNIKPDSGRVRDHVPLRFRNNATTPDYCFFYIIYVLSQAYSKIFKIENGITYNLSGPVIRYIAPPVCFEEKRHPLPVTECNSTTGYAHHHFCQGYKRVGCSTKSR